MSAKSNINVLRWEVVVQTPSASGNTVTWANTAAFAGVETSFSGPEGQTAGAVTGQVLYTLTFRNEVPVTANTRVVWSGKTLRVQSVRMLNLQYIEAYAIEKQ